MGREDKVVWVVIPRYNQSMKTAISIPDELFEAADALAQRMGISRSRLYADAVAEHLAKHRDEEVTQRLDAVYGGAGEPGLGEALRRAQARSVGPGQW